MKTQLFPCKEGTCPPGHKECLKPITVKVLKEMLEKLPDDYHLVYSTKCPHYDTAIPVYPEWPLFKDGFTISHERKTISMVHVGITKGRIREMGGFGLE